MNFKELTIKRSYISFGKENIADSFLVPALKYAKTYKRSVGFFSSGVFEPIIDGIVSLARNKGTIQLVASPRLSAQDIEAIQLGYDKREQIVRDCFDKEFIDEMERFENHNLQLLVDLIARGTLDIKIAVTNTAGDYHDKLGILEDFEGNIVVFYGSANESINGYRNNYEKIRIAKGWELEDAESIKDELDEFEDLWNGTNKFVKVYEYKESAKRHLLQIIENRESGKTVNSKSEIALRDYQKKAIEAWVENDYHGFYVMATGTGKTWTAIYSARELIQTHSAMVVICAPYKHLVKQWAEDVEKAFPTAKIILVSSENPKCYQQIAEEIIRKRYDQNNQIVIISTIASFQTEQFKKTVKKSSEEKLLIVDEAHRFTKRSEELKHDFQYMLGLSATPFSGTSAQKGKALMEFFGGQVFNLPIEEALERGYLVPYYYHPIYVSTTEEEEKSFQYHTHRILSCFKNGRCINPDLLVKSLRNRLRVIAMAEEKQTRIEEIIHTVKERDHFVVYCGDGRVFDGNAQEEIRHIQSVKRVLTGFGFKSSQFTAQENMSERMQLVDAFNKGEISALAAIRCLDEGINIPSINSALILASNDDYREFVQRRGRILRVYKGKEFAGIYDVVVLPSRDVKAWAKIELRRLLEYARLSLNWNELSADLEERLSEYELTVEDVDVYDYEDMEDLIDERE